jgi:hypothetical protein
MQSDDSAVYTVAIVAVTLGVVAIVALVRGGSVFASFTRKGVDFMVSKTPESPEAGSKPLASNARANATRAKSGRKPKRLKNVAPLKAGVQIPASSPD